jgi:hypothetical protein
MARQFSRCINATAGLSGLQHLMVDRTASCSSKYINADDDLMGNDEEKMVSDSRLIENKGSKERQRLTTN